MANKWEPTGEIREDVTAKEGAVLSSWAKRWHEGTTFCDWQIQNSAGGIVDRGRATNYRAARSAILRRLKKLGRGAKS